MQPQGKLALLSSVLALAACGQTQPAKSQLVAGNTSAPVTDPATWPASLTIVGDGFPAPGAACRIVGESAATVDFLDDSASLVGCPTEADVAKLGGKVVATIDGITLVSVPQGNANKGMKIEDNAVPAQGNMGG